MGARSERFWIGNGRTVLTKEVCDNGSVLVDCGKILEVNRPCPNGVKRVDAEGGYIMPGFIDLHVHGGGGADFMDATPECFAEAARTHCRHGTTALLPTTMTCEDSVLEAVIGCFLDAIKIPTGGAELLGLHLEGPFFASAGRGAQPVSEQRIPTRTVLEHFIKLGKGHIMRWDEAPELPNTDIFAAVMRENGITASIAHTAGLASDAYRAFDMGFSHVTHLFSATTYSHKVNGIVCGGMNEAALLRNDITVEVIADGRHIPKETMLLAYRMKGPEKMALITDAMRAAGTSVTKSILGSKTGGVPVVIKDGVAQLPDFSSYAGSIATMDQALRVAHVAYGIPLTDVSCMLSMTPARIAGVGEKKGSLTVGKDADIVVMDADFQVKRVYVGGKQFKDQRTPRPQE